MARALAIFGMVTVHVGGFRTDVQTVSGWLYELPHGRASLLFIMLAGIGVSLLAGDRSPQRLIRLRKNLVTRALLLAPLGLALQLLGTRVAIILQYYAVFFLVALALVRLRDRALLTFALAWSLVGPVLYLAIVIRRPEWFAAAGQPGLDQPVALARAVLLTGFYPALVWAAPLAWGMWLGRRDLRGATTRWRMLVTGAVVAAGAYLLAWGLTRLIGVSPQAAAPSWGLLATAEPHSEMPLWVIGGTGAATALLAGCLWVCDRLPRLTSPLVVTGQLALSVYVGHLFVLAAAPGLTGRTLAAAVSSTALISVGAIAVATAWRALLPRGPLEWALRLPVRSG